MSKMFKRNSLNGDAIERMAHIVGYILLAWFVIGIIVAGTYKW
jgi:hypothetical protein